jgi:hypothetical protein
MHCLALVVTPLADRERQASQENTVTARYWFLSGAVIVGLLGTAHLVLTFVGPKLLPRDRSLREAMMHVSPVITTQTTMWRAWIGFNASHSFGAMLFSLVYGYLALAHDAMLGRSPFLQVVGLALLIGYVVLAKRYWFVTPLIGTTLSLACFAVGTFLAWAA